MKIVERVLERRIRELVNIDSMQFGFVIGRETPDTLFVVRRMQEECRNKKKKLYMCFVNIEKAFDRVPRKMMEWAMKEREIQFFKSDFVRVNAGGRIHLVLVDSS